MAEKTKTKTNKMNKCYRQGDVLLVETTASVRVRGKKIRPEGGRLILARGEATGHHHSLARDKSTSLYAGPNQEMYLLIEEGTKLLEHQEHSTIKIPPGTYKVIRQRQHAPEKTNKVEFVRD